MTITHHPDQANLMSCSAGSMPEGLAAIMAGHLALCAHCRRELTTMHDIGVSLFQSLAPADLAAPAPIVALRAAEADVDRRTPPSNVADGDVPLPLRPVLGPSLNDVDWRRVAPGVWQKLIPLSAGSRGKLRLLKVSPGTRIPEHGHTASELTLVLRGSYTDRYGTFRIGDVAELGADNEHGPVADPVEGCICLIASDGRTRFKGVVARLLQPLSGF